MGTWRIALFVSFIGVLSAEPVCKKCEVVREYNKLHPGEYEYYEDYEKSQGPLQNRKFSSEELKEE